MQGLEIKFHMNIILRHPLDNVTNSLNSFFSLKSEYKSGYLCSVWFSALRLNYVSVNKFNSDGTDGKIKFFVSLLFPLYV
jgi:hypothetical protein